VFDVDKGETLGSLQIHFLGFERHIDSIVKDFPACIVDIYTYASTVKVSRPSRSQFAISSLLSSPLYYHYHFYCFTMVIIIFVSHSPVTKHSLILIFPFDKF